MIYSITTATKKVALMIKKIRAVQGGTSASKTISILLTLIDLSQKDESPKLTSIVSESMPHLKRGALRDFKNIMKGHNYWKESEWSSTDKIYTFPSGSQMEFFSADQSEKLRGGRRDRGFMNECNNMSLDDFDEFEVRTRDFVYLDWNPTHEFWYYEDVEGKRDDVERIVINYMDNEALDEATVKSIEQRKNRKGWYTVYGLGQLGEVEGRIYKNWVILEEIPKEAKLVRYGLDFGYSVDPTSIVAIYEWNGAYIWDEILYKKGLSNKQIADIILAQETPGIVVVADSAEPKSIDEISLYGVAIVGAVKGPDSVRNGIQIVQDEKILTTQRSTHIIKEQRNYMWRTDRDGKLVSPNVPEDFMDHSMDAGRYGQTSLKNPKKKGMTVHRKTSKSFNRRR